MKETSELDYIEQLLDDFNLSPKHQIQDLIECLEAEASGAKDPA